MQTIWNENLEALLHDYKSGRLEEMNKELDNLLIPLTYERIDEIEQEWQKLKSYQEELTDYLACASEVQQKEIVKAAEITYLLEKKIRDKQTYSRKQLAKILKSTQETLEKAAAAKEVDKFYETKEKITEIYALSSAIEYQELIDIDDLLYEGSDKLLLESIIRNTAEANHLEGTYDQIQRINNYNFTQHTNKELEQNIASLATIMMNDHHLPKEYKEFLRKTSERYTFELNTRRKLFKERVNQYTKAGIKVAVLSGLTAFLIGMGVSCSKRIFKEKTKPQEPTSLYEEHTSSVQYSTLTSWQAKQLLLNSSLPNEPKPQTGS